MSETTIKALERLPYSGLDVNLEISLFEYGIAWRPDNLNGTRFIYGVEQDSDGNYTAFNHSWLTKEKWIAIVEDSWFNLPSFLSYVGQSSIEDITGDHWELFVQAAIRYHGATSIFGEDYSAPYEIEPDE